MPSEFRRDSQESLRRLLTRILRHDPASHAVRLTEKGWAELDSIVAAVNRRRRLLRLWQPWTEDDLLAFVATERERFEIRNGSVRARYGHSLPIDLGTIRLPPERLYHGTSSDYLGAIRMLGLRAYSRHDVHLTSDIDYAAKIAETHAGTSVTLGIRAGEACRQGGMSFRQATEHVWLIRRLPVDYIDGLPGSNGKLAAAVSSV